MPDTEFDWYSISQRNARSVQTLIGWIFWDPETIRRLEPEGLPGMLAYVAGRAAPLAPAGEDAVIAAFYTINPDVIRYAIRAMNENSSAERVWQIRNEAAVDGLREFVPEATEALASMTPWLWDAVDACPLPGRPFFGACRSLPRPEEPLLSMWQAVNCLREWRGDTHFAILTSEDVGPVAAGILHNAWVGYEKDWLPVSRGNTPDEIEHAYASLEARGLAKDGEVTEAGVALRQDIEDRTDRLTTLPWEAIGAELSDEFARIAEPACEALLTRVDVTAGPNFQPASRIHDRLAGRTAPPITQ